jgi:hypothetical protein
MSQKLCSELVGLTSMFGFGHLAASNVDMDVCLSCHAFLNELLMCGEIGALSLTSSALGFLLIVADWPNPDYGQFPEPS